MKETIYRQDAINEFMQLEIEIRPSAIEKIIEMLETLPPAQTERTVFEGMSNAEFEKWLHEHGICNPDIHESIPCEVVPLLIDDAINELPAQPEWKKGRWKLLTNGDAICSECGRKQKCVWDFDNWDNFCRHCGADMRGKE